MPEREEATSAADTLHRHGDPDPSNWDEAQAVTGRPQDQPEANTTFAERAKGRKGTKAVQSAENKAVSSGTETKTRKKK